MANDVLRVTGGNAAGTTLQVAGELVIGREGDGVEALGGDAEISRRHAKIVSQPDGGLVIED
ncbi:MAG: hypothetical protein QOF73_2261, partial [Thermomicrobiales bacterium]|nr:hypothetical protein [Thermomicrobiales bacterium]